METTVELDPTAEAVPTNGHDPAWQEFDDNMALTQHIFAVEPPEKIVELPRWNVKILCRSLEAPALVRVQIACYDEIKKMVDYRKDFVITVIEGCYNPINRKKVFTESHRAMLERYGAEVSLLAATILDLSGVLPTNKETTRKN